MARIIRFPLKMKNGAEIRTLDELKENFDLESVLGYFTDGKLATWLADRYYDEKAAAVSALSADMPDLNAKLCEILEVEYKAEVDITNIDKIQRNNEKYKILCTITSDREILDNTDIVAMNQDDLYDILDEETEKIYLYGEKFEIPFERKNINYIGINNPLVIIDKTKYVDDFDEAGIKFKNVTFEEGAFEYRYPDPVGEFEIEDGVLKKGIPNSEGVCIIPYGVTSIDFRAFSSECNWEKILDPQTGEQVNCLEFEGCGKLKDIVIPNSVVSIGDQAFVGCKSLTSVTIPNSVSSIGNYAFDSCRNLCRVIIPDSVRNIGRSAFIRCMSLTSLTIPNSVTRIGDSAFQECKGLTTINIPNSVTSIERETFSSCSSLTTITIPDSVTSIGVSAFSYCSSLTTITIPNSVVSIGNFAFDSCSSLTTITIPNSVVSIGTYAFSYCTRLTNITIPDSVTSIGSGAFSGCCNLISVSINKNGMSKVDIDTSYLSGTPWGKQNGYYKEPSRKKKSIWDIFG